MAAAVWRLSDNGAGRSETTAESKQTPVPCTVWKKETQIGRFVYFGVTRNLGMNFDGFLQAFFVLAQEASVMHFENRNQFVCDAPGVWES